MQVDLAGGRRGQSRLAAELRVLPKYAVEPLHVHRRVVDFIEVVVTGCALVADDTDPRPWPERLADLENLIVGDISDPRVLSDLATEIEDLAESLRAELNPAISAVQRDGFRRFACRLLGTARYTSIVAAMQADAAVVLLVTRRVLRGALPLAVALDDSASLLSQEQIAKIVQECNPTFNGAAFTASLFDLALQLDGLLDQAADHGVPLREATTKVDEQQSLSAEDTSELVTGLRASNTTQARGLVVEVNEGLANKMQGARDALQYSADPVSQAANSLIELIDRLFRRAFPRKDVLVWLDANLPSHRTRLTYLPREGGSRRPTKLGEALCFCYAGRPIEQRLLFNELAAAGLIATREELQTLKHTDGGTETEKEYVLSLINSVEAGLLFVLRLNWAMGAGPGLDRLRAAAA